MSQLSAHEHTCLRWDGQQREVLFALLFFKQTLQNFAGCSNENFTIMFSEFGKKIQSHSKNINYFIV